MRQLPRTRLGRPLQATLLPQRLPVRSSHHQSHESAAATPNITAAADAQQQQQSRASPPPPQQAPKKTMAELDEELRMKMDGRAGDGGAAGVEYENGRAEGLKRGVKANMFRVI